MKGAKRRIDVRLRFHAELARWVEDQQRGYSKLKRKGDAVESTIKVRSIESMKKSLLPFGDKIEVLEPEELREGIFANAGKLEKMYRR